MSTIFESLIFQGGYIVDVIGHKGSQPLPALTSCEDITVHYVPNACAFPPKPLQFKEYDSLQGYLMSSLPKTRGD